jgi:predicted HicB family RNase H-like nuclease
MDKKPVSEARKRANAKYNAKAYEQLPARVKKGRKEKIMNHADLKGESLNSFINRAINETIKRDLENMPTRAVAHKVVLRRPQTAL